MKRAPERIGAAVAGVILFLAIVSASVVATAVFAGAILVTCY